jgi:O-antigen ligase
VSRSAATTASAPPQRRLAFDGLLCFTVLLLLAPQARFPALEPLHLPLLAAAVALAALAWDRLAGRGAELPIAERLLAAGLLCWATLTVPLSHWPGGSVAILTGEYLKSLAVFWLLASAVDSTGRLRRLAWTLTLLSLPLSTTAISHYLTGEYTSAGPGQALQRIAGYQAPLTANPNDLALLLNLLLPLALALLAIERRPLWRLALACAALLDAAAVVATFSRAGFLTLATVVGCALWKLRSRPGQWWLLGAAALGLVFLLVLPNSYLGHLGTITDIASDQTRSAQTRWSDTLTAAGYVADHPIFGAGLGMNILALNEARGATWTQVHNVYLEYAADLGLPGLALFLALFVRCASGVAAVARGAPDRAGGGPPDRALTALAGGVRVSLIAFAVAGFFHPVAYHFYFYYVAGLALAARNIDAQAQPHQSALPLPTGRLRLAAWRTP